MKNSSNKRNFSPTVRHPAARWAFVLVLCAVLGALFRKKGWIKDGDLKLD